jgi:sodium-dependent dicarboxylate transporter 2/3/5
MKSFAKTTRFFVGNCIICTYVIIKSFRLNAMASKVFTVAFFMITLWVTEALAMPIVALIPLVLFPLMKICKVDEAAAPYANPVVFLFMGGFMIGLAIEKWNLHKRIALNIIKFTGTSGNKIILGFIIAAGFKHVA